MYILVRGLCSFCDKKNGTTTKQISANMPRIMVQMIHYILVLNNYHGIRN